MTVGYEVKKEPEFLNVVANSVLTAEDVENFCKEVPELARESGISKVLVDCRAVTHSMNREERIDYALNIAEHFEGIKVAVVADTPFRDNKLFGEVAARERGAQLRMCTNMKEAYFWLGLEQEQSLKS